MELYSEEILRYLGNLNSHPEKRFRSERVKRVKAAEHALLIGAGVGFLVLLAMIPVKLMHPSGAWIVSVAQMAGNVSILCLLAYMLVDIVRSRDHRSDARDI
ncbi:hypothetical protein [Dyella sp. GSA-30]|uniref:hypothetical protein n=1 Tax=Dyella sp. GSA-30 TaxID=2994496 RepID=UPI002493793E|nr:hypothetical protein [Dyella sp. GSA-30]BDU18609.1 hypothetical protein DYGSA30_00660 [Dyella sp. GSA-30]